MAFMKIGTHYDKALREWVEEFEAEYLTDVQALPKANPGSTCRVLETGDTLILAYNGVWGGPEQPFGYETTTVKEVLPECQPEYVASEGVFVLMGESDIAVGEKYIVNWNEVDYECVAVSAPTNSIALGNMSAMGGDNTGEPFLIAHNIDASAWSFIDMTGSTTLTISIRQEVTEVKKISGKYVEGMGYVEKSVKEVLAEQELQSSTQNGDTGVYGYTIDCDLEAGKEYIVVCDGTEYKATSFVFEQGGQSAVALGNLGLSGFGDDTGEPFCFTYINGYGLMCGSTIGPTLTISIRKVSETIHPIDKKFLPSGGGGVTSWNDLEDKPFGAEKADAVKEGLVLTFAETESYFPDVLTVEVGKTYVVNWNGTEYVCTATSTDLGDGVTAATLGNGDTKPFALMFFSAETAAAMGVGGAGVSADGSAEATVSIYNAVVNKLDPAYAPRLLVNVTINPNTESGPSAEPIYTSDKNINEIITAISAGYLVECRAKIVGYESEMVFYLVEWSASLVSASFSRVNYDTIQMLEFGYAEGGGAHDYTHISYSSKKL